MDSQIKELVKRCSVCQESCPLRPAAPLHPWEWPSQPWSPIHIDCFGPYLNHMFMVVVDAHSKWMDACIMEQLRILFATHGLPRKVVTDNGPSFTSEEFCSFLSYNGIAYVTSPRYHPSSNGPGERAVKTLKTGIKNTQGANLQERLSRFLFTYHITPQTTTGAPPSQLLMGRPLRSRLDCLFPDVASRVENHHTRQVLQHNNSRPLCTFKLNDTVYFRLPVLLSGCQGLWLKLLDLCRNMSSCPQEMSFVIMSMLFTRVTFHFSLHDRSRPWTIRPKMTFFYRTFPLHPLTLNHLWSARSRTASDRYGY